jgi:hypothetical protein
MRYFTRGLANGELTDAEIAAVQAAYWKRIAELSPRLPPEVLRLTREVHLHDAIIDRVRWTPTAQRLRLSLVTLTPAGGAGAATITYEGALLGDSRIDALKRAALDRETSVLFDEIDLGEDGVLSHRLLFWPREELSIDFRALVLDVSPRPDNRVQLGGAFVED